SGVREAAAVLAVGEVRLHARRPVVDAEPEIRRDRVRLDHLARVHLPVRVPDRLELAEALDELVAEHLRQELRARLPVAVLSGERASEREDEIGRIGEETAPLGDSLSAREVEVPARVDAALAVVAVESAAVLV